MKFDDLNKPNPLDDVDDSNCTTGNPDFELDEDTGMPPEILDAMIKMAPSPVKEMLVGEAFDAIKEVAMKIGHITGEGGHSVNRSTVGLVKKGGGQRDLAIIGVGVISINLDLLHLNGTSQEEAVQAISMCHGALDDYFSSLKERG
jgi:hypothetical protein